MDRKTPTSFFIVRLRCYKTIELLLLLERGKKNEKKKEKRIHHMIIPFGLVIDRTRVIQKRNLRPRNRYRCQYCCTTRTYVNLLLVNRYNHHWRLPWEFTQAYVVRARRVNERNNELGKTVRFDARKTIRICRAYALDTYEYYYIVFYFPSPTSCKWLFICRQKRNNLNCTDRIEKKKTITINTNNWE